MPKKKTKPSPRCEGFRRYGGAFTLGPVRWEQCKNRSVVTLEIVQDGKTQSLPSCATCWSEAIEKKIQIKSATPIP
jgi:hypothetical protein